MKNFFAKQKCSGATVTTLLTLCKLAGNMFLLNNTFLCLASFCSYRLYEVGPMAGPKFMELLKHKK